MPNTIERYYGVKGLYTLAVHLGVVMTELRRHVDASIVENFANNKYVKDYVSQHQALLT